MTNRIEYDDISITLNSEEDASLFKLLQESSRNREIEKTKALLEKFISAYPKVGMFHAFLANTYWDEENYTEAEREFLKAIHIDQTNEKISVGYFHLLMELNRSDDAFSEIKRFVSKGGTMRRYQEILSELK